MIQGTPSRYPFLFKAILKRFPNLTVILLNSVGALWHKLCPLPFLLTKVPMKNKNKLVDLPWVFVSACTVKVGSLGAGFLGNKVLTRLHGWYGKGGPGLWWQMLVSGASIQKHSCTWSGHKRWYRTPIFKYIHRRTIIWSLVELVIKKVFHMWSDHKRCIEPQYKNARKYWQSI